MIKSFLWISLAIAVAGGLGCVRAHAAPEGLPIKTSWVEANGVSLRCELTGSGSDTLVLIHEMCMSLETWDLIMPELVNNYRVLRYDLRGFGLSEKIVGAVTYNDHVEDLRTLLGALKIEGKVTLIGGAVGGAVSLAFAAKYPKRVRGVVAMSPAANLAPLNPDAIMAVAASTEHATMRSILDEQLIDIYPESIQVDAERIEWFRSIQLATDTRSLAASLRMIATTDFTGILKKIEAPALIIAAALYPARPVASMQKLADSIETGQLEVLQTGHFMAAQSPELLMPVLERFLGQLPR